MIEDDNSAMSADIFITPPGDDEVSAEDSDDDDQPSSINHLSRAQLSAEADAKIVTVSRRSKRLNPDYRASDSSDDDSAMAQQASTSSCQKKRKLSKKATKEPQMKKWEPGDLSEDVGCVAAARNQPLFLSHDLTPADLFELFFDEDIINLLVENTVKYAREQKGDHCFEVTAENMKLFIAVLLLNGYAILPRRRMYWEQQPDVLNAAVSNAIPRKRFEDILRYLHVADNKSLGEGDKFSKVRPLVSQLNERWLMFKPPDSHLSIDESMIPYYGKHGAKQHIHGKPIRFGYKMWSLATSSGYLIQGEPYQGASTSYSIPELGMGGSVVMDLISELPRCQKYFLYFDNLFTSLPLLDKLSAEDFGATGTIRVNRTRKAPLKDLKILLIQERGVHYAIKEKSSEVVLVQWHDSNVVTLASNCHSVLPLNTARRWSNKDKKVIFVNQPHVVHAYNRHMGGVDRLDQNVATYRISIRTKKWWWPVFSFLVSASVNNAWLLYRQSVSSDTEKLDLLEFTRRIVNTYIQKHSIRSNPTSRRRVVVASIPQDKRVLPEVRFDRLDHTIESIPKQRRCARCGKKVSRQCSKCRVALHVVLCSIS
jgi:hypothetical protein